MKAVFSDSQEVEKEAKARYHFPDFIMMENAAAALEENIPSDCKKLLIVCGSGNNGGDGYALARRLQGKSAVILASGLPKTDEAKIQRQMAEACGLPVFESLEELEKKYSLSDFDVIVDCILGTGFTGQLRENISLLIEKLNSQKSYKIACDIPTGFAFKADLTVTMGCLKSRLFSDAAKNSCGKILTANLGIDAKKFEACGKPDAFLLEKDDIKLPLRKNKASHKGTFGHTAVFAGEKSGAGILAGQAALNFGSGLVTLIKSENSNLFQFKICPELMINDEIPSNATSILIGSGLGRLSDDEKASLSVKKCLQKVKDFYCQAKNPACLFDADLFSWKDFPAFLDQLSAVRPDGKIILTPHLKELKIFCDFAFPKDEELTVAGLSSAEKRIETGRKICRRFPNVTLVMKSANTFIATGEEIFICDRGAPSLAKAGSGDVLAGMCAALLAQGYTGRDAAITAVYAHALAGSSFAAGQDWALTAEKLTEKLGR